MGGDASNSPVRNIQKHGSSARFRLPAGGPSAISPDGELAAGSMSGNVYFPADTVDDIAGATAIGTHLVVPTPGAIALLGLAGLARSRRR